MAQSFWRRLRRGQPIIVVSGLPRSGTSMAMGMLEAGGLAVVTDGLRAADASNPKGYYEFERVKDLDKPGDHAWLADARGKAVKIISFLLTWLPEDFNYQVIFMQRDLDEVLASQQQMLARRGEDADTSGTSREVFQSHLAQVERFMAARSCFETLYVPYRDAVATPEATAAAVARFLGRSMDTAAMAQAVEASLYRNRA